MTTYRVSGCMKNGPQATRWIVASCDEEAGDIAMQMFDTVYGVWSE